MPVESVADRAAFVNPDEFGVAATYKGITTVNGIFDTRFIEALDGSGAGVSARQPMFTCQESDLDGAAQGDALVINGTAYTILESEPDGTGMIVLILEQA